MAPNILDLVAKKAVKDDVRSRIVESSVNCQPESAIKTNTKEPSLSSSGSNGGINKPQETSVFKPQIRWPDLIAQIFIHVGSLYGLYYLITLQAKFYTYVWCKFRQIFVLMVENQFSFNFSRRAGVCIGNWNHSW